MSLPPDPTNMESMHQKVGTMAIIGHTTTNSCKLWIRTYCPGKWWLVITQQPLSGDLYNLEDKDVDEFLSSNGIATDYLEAATTDSANDNIHVFEIDGLKAGMRYYYSLLADKSLNIYRRTEIGIQEKKSFTTQTKNIEKFSFGFSSCHDPFSQSPFSEGAWPSYLEALKDRNALFCINGGDQVYVDSNDKCDMYSVWEWLATYKNEIIQTYSDENGLQKKELIQYFAKIYRNYYRIYWNFISMKKTYETFPQYMIWDDHEIMDGWGSYSKAERKKLLNKFFQNDDEETNDQIVRLMFEAAKQVYFEYQHSHNPTTEVDLNPDNNANCVWDYNFSAGGCGFYVLDMRGHHDYERHDQGNALLGNLQMARLQAWLQKASTKKAHSVFIVSPVPVVHWGPLISSLDFGSLKDDMRDEWEHDSNTVERNKLLDTVMKFSNDNNCTVTILSGDVHSASVFQFENFESAPRAKVFNVTSSAISRKPFPGNAEWFMKKSGKLEGYSGGSVNRLYAKAGECNFMIVNVDNTAATPEVSVDLCWPGGSEGELVRKKVKLN